jgi:ER lumen protein retaining receptor
MDEEESTDTFRVEYAIVPCAVLASFINYGFSVMEIMWSFSIFLEAVAILPQLHMLKRTGQAEALTRYYILALGSYRALYILNWIHRCVAWHPNIVGT